MADYSRKSPGKPSEHRSAFRLGRPRLAKPAVKRLLVVLAAALAGIGIWLPLHSAHATGSFTSANSGFWNSPSTWVGNSGFPTCADDVTITSGITVTLDTTRCSNNLTIQSGGVLDMKGQQLSLSNSGITFTNNGTLANSAGFAILGFFGNGTFGAITQSLSGNGVYTGGVRLELYTSVGVNVAPATALTFASAGNQYNVQIDGGSVLTLTNALTITAPNGANFVGLLNYGSVTGSGGVKTHGSVYLLANSGVWSAPVEIVSGGALGYGTFAGPFVVDSGASIQLQATLNLYDNLTIPSGAILDLNGQVAIFQGNGKTFSNNGTLASGSGAGIFEFYGDGTPGDVLQTFSGSGTYSSSLQLRFANNVAVHDGPSTALTFADASNQNNIQIDGGSVLTMSNPLTLTAPVGANFVQVVNNNGAVAGNGGLKTHGDVYLYGGGVGWSAPVEIVSDVAQGYGSFAGPFVLDSGTKFVMDGPLNLYDNLTIPAGATLDFNGYSLYFLGNGTTFTNNGVVTNSAGSAVLYFYGNGTQGAIVQHFARSGGSFTTNLLEQVTNCDTVVLDGDAQLGAVQIDNCSVLDITNHTLKLSAPGTALTVNGTIITTGSNIEMDGTAQQHVQTSLNGALFSSLTINNPAGVDIPNPSANPLTIPAILTLTNGLFTLNNNLTIGNGATIARAAGSLDSAPAFAGTVNIRYFGATALAAGFELPPSKTINNLTDSDTNPVTLGISLTVNGNALVAAGATLAGTNGKTINVDGGWTNNGAFSANGSTVNFDGAAPQTIGGTAATTFDGLTINNGAGVTLGSNASVNLTLTLSTDLTTTGSYTLSLGTNEIATGSADVIGRVSRGGFVQGTRYSFGNPDVQVAFGAGDIPSSLSVELARSAPAGLALAVGRTYTLTAASGSVFSATVRLRYLDSEVGSLDENRLGLWRNPGSSWLLAGESARDTGANWVEQAGVTAFGRFGLSDLFLQLFLPFIKR